MPSLDTIALGVAEFSGYSLIIDARTPAEFEEDHLPGASNLPVVDGAEFAEVGIAYAKDPHTAYLIGAEYASRNLANHIRSQIAGHSKDERFLVYCFRGGKRSRVWADTLRNIGFSVDVLPGGWKAYRRWVLQALETLPPLFEYRVVSGLTGCGKTRLLHALEHAGEQVLDLEGLAVHRGSLIGAIPGRRQPSQKAFDGQLLAKLRAFEVVRPVWVESESKKVGNLQLPDALVTAMQKARRFEIEVPMAGRVKALRDDYPHFVAAPTEMVIQLQPLMPLVGKGEIALWSELASTGQVDQLFERVLVAHYDPSYRRSQRNVRNSGEPPLVLSLSTCSGEELAAAALKVVQL